MSDVKGRYPLSTADGQSIPLDTIRPNSAVQKTFIAGSSTAALTCPATIDLFSILVDQSCILTFAASSASAAALSDGVAVADTLLIPANTIIVVTPPIGKKSFALRGISSAGTALINFLESWTGLALASQSPRR